VSKGWRQRGLPRLPSIRWPSWRASRTERITERRGPSLPNPLAAPEDVGSRPDVRLWVVGAVFAALFAFMGVRLAFLQLADHAAYAATVQTNTLRTVSIPAPRGQIVSREGTKLVANTVHQELVLSRLQASSVPGLVGRVAALAGIPVNQVVAALANVQYSPYQPVPILTDTPTKVIIYLEEHHSMFPGVSVETLTERTYPAGGDLAPQVLGYVGPITADQYAQLASKGGYTPNSTIGQDGIEEYYDEYLRGVAGTQEIEVDASGDPIQTVVNSPPVTGDTVVLNLDGPLQSFLSNALAEDILRVRSTLDPRSGRYPPAPNGAAVVLDPRNGHVLAMASYPSYNLDVWKGGISAANYASLLGSTALNNNVTGGLYTPGSTFKLVTATAALQDHLISPAQYVDDTGKFTIPNCVALHNAGCSFRDDEVTGLGEVDLPLAITESSDYYFYNLGYQFWNDYTNIPHYRYGETPIQDVATAYGLTAPTGVDLPGESSSIVDSPQVRLAEHKQYPKLYPNYQWFTGDNIEMAFGQGGTVLTPLGLADAYATFANGGKRFQPEVAAAVVSAEGKVVQLYGPKVTGKVSLPPSVRGPILQGLLGVVNDPSGTAYATFHTYTNFDLSSFPIAGKTGTASNEQGEEPNSWFVGFGPVDHARYVVLCVIAQGGYGADAAAPVVAQTFDYLVQHPVGALHLPLTYHVARHGPAGSVTTTTTKP
jgi:penicillin-binding protein 2